MKRKDAKLGFYFSNFCWNIPTSENIFQCCQLMLIFTCCMRIFIAKICLV